MSDSPNVMRGKHKGVLKLIKDSHAPHLLDLGGCSLHDISSTVVYATKEFGQDIEDFLQDLFYFFRNHPAAVEDFKGHLILFDLEQKTQDSMLC